MTKKTIFLLLTVFTFSINLDTSARTIKVIDYKAINPSQKIKGIDLKYYDSYNAAINAAIDTAENGDIVEFEAGIDYYVDAGIKSYITTDTSGSIKVIKKKGLTINLNGSKIIAIPNSEPNYCILGIISSTDIKIYNGTIEGDRKNHVRRKVAKDEYGNYIEADEWGYGLILGKSCSNILIENVTAKECWGDGFVIGDLWACIPDERCKNITIINCTADSCRRNGLSVCNVDGLLVNGGNLLIQEWVAHTKTYLTIFSQGQEQE